MKQFLIICALIGSYSVVSAQSKNDPTYSIHNYKQPNKAEEARLIKKEGVDNESYAPEKNVANRNYKASNRENETSGAALAAAPVEKNTNALASNGNYKSSFGKSNTIQRGNESDSYSSPVVKSKGFSPKNH